MCGSGAGSVTTEEQKIYVHGDIFNSETRTALAILEIGDISVIFRQ